MRRADDHRLAATLGEPGQRGLVAHALGQAHGIADRTLLVGVGQVAATTEGRAETCVVDGDYGLEARDWILREVQFLKPGGFHHGEHAVAPLLLVTASIGAAPEIARPGRHKCGLGQSQVA
ncbi:hypothetical protein D3C86_1415660 [compost metagenome]